ncbi:MAG: hypothetical protein DWQ35_16315 [Planctomycetota bacterium]|nr:MAG: hypothetical protein DWQ29_08885 [Planctomycetota bacterium]REJ90444.1 MAG: hypothetical protein DWQ35_16315 [Planctomycetota bacterium]
MRHNNLHRQLANLGYPHWRFGQLVANVAGWEDADLWDVEDAQMLAAARAHLEAVAQREEERQRA